MGLRIHQLPTEVANQIAAGEVIERPASVVKELLENSLDAEANYIGIEIGYGGLNKIKISDNGRGIFAEDLPLAIAPHATSKISALEDLYTIASMGFRGEALASIASVARLTISSRPAQQETAMTLQIRGSEVIISPCARNVGTTIEVSDLFFNAPVRKRFLKSEKLEFQAIEAVIKRFALSAPHIALNLKHNNKLILALPAALNDQTKQLRLSKIFGSSFIKEALFLDVQRGGMSLTGWISGLNFQRSQNDRQWVYINGRMVKDKLINHALKQVYEGLLHPGRFPACLLYFTINHSEVDVNVHPTKYEVRFQQPRLIHDFFTSQLTEALNSQLIKKEIVLNSPLMKIHEPESFQYSSSIAPLIAKANSSRETCFSDSSWLTLNNRYCLLVKGSQTYVIDIVLLQQYWLEYQLSQSPLPLEFRPLLVTVQYIIPSNCIYEAKELTHYLNQLGLQINFLASDTILIKTIPVKVPYLDLNLFLEKIFQLETIQLELLLQLMIQSQIFDPLLLGKDEKMALQEWLFANENSNRAKKNIVRCLTEENCRMLFHV